jgi:hypothetical protein
MHGTCSDLGNGGTNMAALVSKVYEESVMGWSHLGRSEQIGCIIMHVGEQQCGVRFSCPVLIDEGLISLGFHDRVGLDSPPSMRGG